MTKEQFEQEFKIGDKFSRNYENGIMKQEVYLSSMHFHYAEFTDNEFFVCLDYSVIPEYLTPTKN